MGTGLGQSVPDAEQDGTVRAAPEKVDMLIGGHETRSVFERYNIVDERGAIEATSRLNTYTSERADAEKAAVEAAKAAKENIPANGRHTVGTQFAKSTNEIL